MLLVPCPCLTVPLLKPGSSASVPQTQLAAQLPVPQVPVLAVADVLWMLPSKRGEPSASRLSKGLGCLTPMVGRIPWPVQSPCTRQGHHASTGGL